MKTAILQSLFCWTALFIWGPGIAALTMILTLLALGIGCELERLSEEADD